MRASFASFSMAFGAVLALAACSSSSSSGGDVDGGTDAAADATSDGTTSDTGGGKDASVDGGVCWDEAGNWIYDFKACSSDADCTTAEYDKDCCGTTEIIGIAKSRLADYPACESSWAAHFAPCNCPPGPMTAEDGKPVSDPGAALVHCTNFTSSGGVCMSYGP
jgi:hypothetical protein